MKRCAMSVKLNQKSSGFFWTCTKDTCIKCHVNTSTGCQGASLKTRCLSCWRKGQRNATVFSMSPLKTLNVFIKIFRNPFSGCQGSFDWMKVSADISGATLLIFIFKKGTISVNSAHFAAFCPCILVTDAQVGIFRQRLEMNMKRVCQIVMVPGCFCRRTPVTSKHYKQRGEAYC